VSPDVPFIIYSRLNESGLPEISRLRFPECNLRRAETIELTDTDRSDKCLALEDVTANGICRGGKFEGGCDAASCESRTISNGRSEKVSKKNIRTRAYVRACVYAFMKVTMVYFCISYSVFIYVFNLTGFSIWSMNSGFP